MKLKSLLLGSAAGLFAVTGAQAADLPVAEPVEYVRVCDAFGAGFFYIPGTDTCLKVGGRVRAEAHYTHGFDDDNFRDRERGDRGGFVGRDEASPEETRSYNNFTTRARGYVNLDARTQSDIGVVRAYVQIFSTIGPATGPAGNESIEDYSTSSVTLDEAFVSLTNDWGVFKAGRTFTNFDFFRGYAFDTIIGSDDPSDTVNQFAITGTLGEGISATIAIEDPRTIGRTVSLDEGDRIIADNPDDGGVDDVFAIQPEAGPDGLSGGQRFPDAVGNLRFDGGWGSAQIMGVLHHVREAEFALDRSFNPQDNGTSELGWAAGAGGTLKVPNTNIEASLQGVYGKGAIGYVTTGNGAPRTDGIVQRVLVRQTAPVADNPNRQILVPFFTDDIELTEAWAINAGVSVGLTETITASVTGAYADVQFGDEGQNGRPPSPNGRLGRVGGVFTPRLVDDYDTWTLAGTLSVTPIAGLLAGIELEYENVDFDENSGQVLQGRRGVNNRFIDDFRGNDESEDDRWGGMVRIQRTF